MQVTPLAAESMGARSMATFVETADTKILIDPGLWLAEHRYKLKPLSVEHWTVEKLSRRIGLFLESARVIVLSHLHPAQFDLLTPQAVAGKTIFIKNPNQKTSAGRRNKVFSWMSEVRPAAKAIEFADGRRFSLGSTRLVFSKPLCEAGDCDDYVLALGLQVPSAHFVFSSEIAGNCDADVLRFISSQRPHLLYLDGPATYGYTDGGRQLSQKMDAMRALIVNTGLRQIILDHHTTRDFDWRQTLEPVFELARQRDLLIQTAAEFRGEAMQLLESRRRQLFEEKGRQPLPYEESL